MRLSALGWLSEGADLFPKGYGADRPFTRVDLNGDTAVLPSGVFDLVTALEVVEHVYSPTALFSLISRVLAPGGSAIVTTPNVDGLAARLKFAVTGRLRMFDAWGDPTHLTPIFLSLLPRLLEPSGLALTEVRRFPAHGVIAGRPVYRPALRALERFDRHPGDNHIFFLRHGQDRSPAEHRSA